MWSPFLSTLLPEKMLRLFSRTLSLDARSLLQLRSFSEQAAGKWTKEALDATVKGSKVVVFMKGVPAQPMCGFSNAVVQILKMHGVENYANFNVLDDQELRQNIKDYSNWPTIPQIYLGGEFVGGCDIFLQMHQNGELVEELKKIGLRSALLDKDGKDQTEEN